MSDNFMNGRISRRRRLDDGTVLAPPVGAPKAPAFLGTPLDADRISRLFVETLDPSPRPPTLRFLFKDPKDCYQVDMEIPKGHYNPQELERIRETVLGLNQFLKTPVTTFWRRMAEGAGSLYSPEGTIDGRAKEQHIELGQGYATSRHRRVESTICDLTHEMGHALEHQKFRDDPQWKQIYLRSLIDQNYEIIDDSNYLIDISDPYGHPYENAHEAFASAFHAYLQHADELVAYIQNPQTPETMRTFGKLVWCYMRERVLDGRVFTSRRVDPFARERFESLLGALPGNRMNFLRRAYYQDKDPEVRKAVAERLGEIGPSEAKISVPILMVALGDEDAGVRLYATWALAKLHAAARPAAAALITILDDPDKMVRGGAAMALGYIGPGADQAVPHLTTLLKDSEADVRDGVAWALGKMGPAARASIPALQISLQDPNERVRDSSKESLREIFFTYP